MPGCTGSPPTIGCDGCIFHLSAPRSARRRATAAKRTLFSLGIHPATGAPVDHDHHCADCTHLIRREFAVETRFHCALAAPKLRLRLSWPACERFTPVSITPRGVRLGA